MARLPIPGGDSGSWGNVLNEFLAESLTSSGAVKPGIIAESNLTSAVQTKLNEIAPVTSVAGKTGDVVLDHNDVGAASVAQGSLADSAVQPGDLDSANADLIADSGSETATELAGLIATTST